MIALEGHPSSLDMVQKKSLVFFVSKTGSTNGPISQIQTK